jgi:outer membrane receptor protein involved in Fe transport
MISNQPQRHLLASAVLVALVSLIHAPSAPAQDTLATADDVEAEPTRLDGLTVTAQKRDEQLQDVPIAVTTLSQELLQDTGVRDVKDLQVLVPGLTVSSTQSDVQTVARIRGVGTVGDNTGLESSVGIVIDGVYRPRNGVGFGDLGEIERIEVLKGPQGTVFGKNTSAGVINVITRRPSYEHSVEGEITVGNYGALGIAGAYNNALGDNAAVRIYAAEREREGFMDVHTGAGPRTEHDDYDQNFHSLRGQLLLEPTDDLDFNVIADYTRREENCCTGATIVRGPTAAIIDALAADEGVSPTADPFAREAWSNRDTAQDIEDKGISAQADWNTPWFGGATLTSITAWRDWQAINGVDYDFSTADLIYRNPEYDDNFTGFETFTQELRLTGATDSVDWMFGLFYSDEDLARNEAYRIGSAYEPYLSTALLGRINPALAGLPNAPLFLSEATGLPFGTSFIGHGASDVYQQNANSLALFTNNTWHATDALDLTFGLRYTREDKELDSAYSNPNGGAGCSTYFLPTGQLDPAALGRISQALLSRGIPAEALPAIIPQVVAFTCLPWANPLHNGRATHQESNESEWSGTLKAAYRWNEQVMTYFSAARGYKAGGFNLDRVQSGNGLSSGTAGIVPVNDTSFPGEFVDSYELGAKTTWADGNLLLNATLFHQTYSDFQLNSFLGTSFVVRSIPEVVSKGVDSEILWQPGLEGLMLQGGLMYADTTYGDDLLPDADLAALPGNRVSFAPKWSATTAITYEWDFADSLLGRFNIGAKYMSDYNTGSDLDLEKMQDAYTLVNARIGIGARDERWMLEAWAQNLTDVEYIQVGFDAPLQTGSFNAFLGAPRTYGLTLRMKF